MPSPRGHDAAHFAIGVDQTNLFGIDRAIDARPVVFVAAGKMVGTVTA